VVGVPVNRAVVASNVRPGGRSPATAQVVGSAHPVLKLWSATGWPSMRYTDIRPAMAGRSDSQPTGSAAAGTATALSASVAVSRKATLVNRRGRTFGLLRTGDPPSV